MVLSVFAGPASAALAPGSGPTETVQTSETQSVSTTDAISDQVVPSGELVNAGENVSIWQGSILTLRASDGSDNDQSRDVRLNISKTNVELTDRNISTSLRKDPLYIYRRGESVTYRFDGNYANNGDVIEGEKVQVVTAHLKKGAGTPRSFTDVSNLLTDNDNVEASVVGNFTGESNANLVSDTPSKSGQYVVAVVAVNNATEQGFADTNDDGNLEATSDVTIVGFDYLPVHEERSTVEVPDAAATGSTVSVTVDSGTSIASDNVSHTVLLYNETVLDAQEETIVANGTGIEEVRTSIEYINGTRDIADGTNVAGISPGQSTYTGSTSAADVINRLLGSQGQNVNVTGNTTLHVAAASTVGGPRENVSLRVTDEFPEGEYQLLHIATARDGEQTVSNKQPLSLSTGVDLNITANRTDVVTGSPVELTVTRDDTTDPVDATVTFDGQELSTGTDGTVVVTAPTETGTFTATATKAPDGQDVFVSDSVNITVSTPATIEYSNLSVSPRTVPTNETVTVNVTVENTGETEGIYNASVIIDGTETGAEQNGTLAPDESTQLTFRGQFGSPGARQVTVADLAPQRVRVLAPAAFDPGNVEASPLVNVSEQFRVRLPVNNTGDIGGTFYANLTVRNESGAITASRNRSVFLDGGENRTVSFSRVAVREGNLTATITGTPAEPTSDNDTVRVVSPDVQPPAIVLESPSQGETPYGRTVTLNVTDADSSVSSVTTQFNDGQTQSQNSGEVTLNTTGLTEGTNTLNVTATDESGNTARETYTFDFVSAPRITSVSPTSAAGATPQIVVRYDDNRTGEFETGINTSATRLLVNGNPVDAANVTSNQTTLVAEPAPENLTSGTNTVRVEVTDNAGHTTLRRFSFGRDATPPNVTIESDTVTSVGINDPAELNLTADDPNLKLTALVVTNTTTGLDDPVYVQNLSAVARSTGGVFRAEWDARDDAGNPVPDGEYNITLAAEDTAGNINSTNLTTVVDNTAPAYTFSSLNTSETDTVDAANDTTLITNDTTLTVDYTVSEDVDLTYRITPVRSGGIVTTQEFNADAGAGTSELPLSSLSDGRYRVTALVNDETENTNRTTATAVVEIDRTSPTLGATLRLTNDNEKIRVNVTSEEPLAGTPTASVDTPSSGSAETVQLSQVDNSQLYQGELPTNQSGSYNLTATGVDLAGNTRTATANTTLNTTDIGEDQNITILGPNTFVFIQTNKTNIEGGVSDVTYRLSETESLGIALSGQNARRFLQAEVGGLSDDQIDRVTYGFKAELAPNRGKSGVNLRVLYFPDSGGVEVLQTNNESDPISAVSGYYYVAEREGLSDYAIVEDDSQAPEITFTTPSQNAASFSADTTSVDISASVTDNVALNESNITVTFDDSEVTQEANIVNNSVDDKKVEYTATGLSPGDYTFTITASDQNRTANVNTSSLDFTVQSDNTAPNVTDQNPTGELDYGTTQVEINATYEDAESGIDEDNVSIIFDGTDVTGSATVTGSKVSQTVSVDNGTTYTVNVSVPNRLGNVTTKNTTFSVAGDGEAPTITVNTPTEDQEFGTDTQNVTLDASVTDAGGSGLDNNSIAVYFDGVDKTAAASVSDPENVTYTTPDLESGSTHNLTVVAADNAGNVTVETRNFSIGADTQVPSITRVSSNGETLQSGEDLDLEVDYNDDGGSGIDPTSLVLRVNGTEYTDQATKNTTAASVTVPAANLSAGEQSVVVSVSDNASNTNRLTTTFSVAEGSDIRVTDIRVNDSTVLTDEAVAVNVTVANFGDEAGNKTLAVSSGSATPDSAEADLGPGEITFKEFTVSFDEPGDVDVTVNGTTGPTVSVQSRTANFVLADQSVTTSVVSGNETTVAATIQNTGSKTGTGNLTADGQVLEEITLKPSQTRKLEFTQNLEATGSDQTVTYAFGNLTIGTTTVTPTQPRFQVVSDTIAPGTVNTGQTVTVTVRVRNNGGQSGSFQTSLAANGNSRVTNATTIANGATRTITYQLSFDSSGTYRLTLGRFVLGNVTVNARTNAGNNPSVSSGGGGGGGGAVGSRTLVGKTSYLGGGQNIGISLGPGSRGVERVDVEFSEATAGQVNIAELDRPPADTDYSRNYASTVVSVLNIRVPSTVTNKPATLTISVRQSRLDDMGVTPDQLQVERYNDGEWQVLDSQVVETNGQTVRIRVETPGFSLFAVTTKSAQATPTAAPQSSPTDTATPTDDDGPATLTGTATLEGDTTPPEQSTSTQFPGFGVALTLLALLAAVGLLARRRD